MVLEELPRQSQTQIRDRSQLKRRTAVSMVLEAAQLSAYPDELLSLTHSSTETASKYNTPHTFVAHAKIRLSVIYL